VSVLRRYCVGIASVLRRYHVGVQGLSWAKRAVGLHALDAPFQKFAWTRKAPHAA